MPRNITLQNNIITDVKVICDICGTEQESEDSINFIGTIGSPGHPEIAPFQQDHVEGWACSPAHWLEMAHRDVEHLYQKLLSMQQTQKEVEQTRRLVQLQQAAMLQEQQRQELELQQQRESEQQQNESTKDESN